MEPTQLVALSLIGAKAVSNKSMELAQLVALSLVGDQPVTKKGVELRQWRSLRPGKKTGHLKQGQGAAATWLLRLF